jgi:hypothetical protein
MIGAETMQKLFPSYYAHSAIELKELWNNCFFAFDSSVLLNLYRFPMGASSDFLKVLGHLKDRLWLPHQVALEFQRNRSRVRFEQVARFGAVFAALERVQSGLKADLEKLQLKKRHSSIDPDFLLIEVSGALSPVRSRLEALQQEQEEALQADPVHDAIVALFEGRIGASLSPEETQKVFTEGAIRYRHKRPPGYMDQDKAKEAEAIYYFESHPMEAQYGDLLVWMQLIAEAKRRSAKDVIFVTDDDKEDWWLEYSGKTVGPRRELIDEVRISANVERFHMYNSERFMEYAKEHLGVAVQSASIAEIRESKDASSRRTVVRSRKGGSNSTRMVAIHHWLCMTFPAGSVTALIDRVADFEILEEDRTFGVVALPRLGEVVNLLGDAPARVQLLASGETYTHLILLIASANKGRLRGLQMHEELLTLVPFASIYLLGLDGSGKKVDFSLALP